MLFDETIDEHAIGKMPDDDPNEQKENEYNTVVEWEEQDSLYTNPIRASTAEFNPNSTNDYATVSTRVVDDSEHEYEYAGLNSRKGSVAASMRSRKSSFTTLPEETTAAEYSPPILRPSREKEQTNRPISETEYAILADATSQRVSYVQPDYAYSTASHKYTHIHQP